MVNYYQLLQSEFQEVFDSWKKHLGYINLARLWNVKHVKCSAEPWTATFQFEDTLLIWVKYICSSSPYKSHLFTDY